MADKEKNIIDLDPIAFDPNDYVLLTNDDGFTGRSKGQGIIDLVQNQVENSGAIAEALTEMDAKITEVNQIVVQGFKAKANWNIATNTPNIATIPKDEGDAFVVKGPGTTSITGTSITAKDGDVFQWSDGAFVYRPNASIPGDNTVTPEKTTFITSGPDGSFTISDSTGNVGLKLSATGVLSAIEINTEVINLNGQEIVLADLVTVLQLAPIEEAVNDLTLSIDTTTDFTGFRISDSNGNIGLTLTQSGLKVVHLLLGDTSLDGEGTLAFSLSDSSGYAGFFVTKTGEAGAKKITVKDLVVTGSISMPLPSGARYPASPWFGKYWHWAGTSIPAGSVGVFPSYPVGAAAHNGAIVFNKAQGSSPIRAAKTDGTFTGIAWQSYTRAYTHTIAEKQFIIDNWATVRTSLTGSPPATLTQADKDLMMVCTYENALLPFLNGTHPMPDLFVMDHGVNDESYDSVTPANFYTIPAVRNNKNYFLGACNFIFDLILQYNPRARIVIIGHHENTLRPAVPQAQQVLANYWGFPFLKLWEKTGWSNQIVPGSASLWAVPPYNGYTSTGADISVFRVWNPDNLHPHTDTTGKSLQLLANIVGEFLSRTY